MDRRDFLRRGLAAGAAGFVAGGPLQGLVARMAMAQGSTGVAPDNGGYGPLVPVVDLNTGLVLLHLPAGFRYRSFGYTGEVMLDGVLTPGRQDGMAAFPGPQGRVRLVRNHEQFDPSTTTGAFGDLSKAYDPAAPGGTTTLEMGPLAERVESWVSTNGTNFNCAGGVTPWGSWITAEESINGPDANTNFLGPVSLVEKHGYIYEVPSSWGPGAYQEAVPIRASGRFNHEAVSLDPETGILYETEDNFTAPSGFYRYRPPAGRHPVRDRRLSDGGRLEMLAVADHRGRPLSTDLYYGQTPGVTYPVTWVSIEDPNPRFPVGISNDDAGAVVSSQGFALGGAKFSRLEGSWYGDGKIYFDSTEGGGELPDVVGAQGFGLGFGQTWMLDIRSQTLTLIFESPGPEVLELPDNLTITPKHALLLCEDGPIENYVRGLTQDGLIFDFALNAIPGEEAQEFAGACFSPDGRLLFVNIQASSGRTFAIWGPWQRGPI